MRHYPELRMERVPLSAETLRVQDAVLIATDHSAYDWEDVVRHAALVIDTRNATRGVRAGREKIVKA
jgi:UDP-N-acetyl-D-glucosamine dehydrogenase